VNPTNCFTSNDARATFNNTGQNDLQATGYGFAIPAGSTINGIIVRREGNGHDSKVAQRRFRIGLTKDGTALAGTRKTAQNLPQTTDDTVDIGTATDLWGTTWSAGDVNASTFGVLVSDNDTTAANLLFDWVAVIVDYTAPASGAPNRMLMGVGT
jgi:hypothetical protein